MGGSRRHRQPKPPPLLPTRHRSFAPPGLSLTLDDVKTWCKLEKLVVHDCALVKGNLRYLEVMELRELDLRNADIDGQWDGNICSLATQTKRYSCPARGCCDVHGWNCPGNGWNCPKQGEYCPGHGWHCPEKQAKRTYSAPLARFDGCGTMILPETGVVNISVKPFAGAGVHFWKVGRGIFTNLSILMNVQ